MIELVCNINYQLLCLIIINQGDQPIFTYGISTGPSEAQRFRTQDKEGQQMGATLFSTGDTFIVS